MFELKFYTKVIPIFLLLKNANVIMLDVYKIMITVCLEGSPLITHITFIVKYSAAFSGIWYLYGRYWCIYHHLGIAVLK